jgi:hypothetical protein
MKKRFLFFYLMLLLMGAPVWAQLVVTNSPTGAAVVLTQPSAVFVTWTVQSGDVTPTTAVSEEGLFVSGPETLGRVGTFLTTSVGTNGSGIATETLLIPPDVSNRALKRNVSTFFYQRTFHTTSNGASGQARLTCRLSTSAYGNFSIAAVTLFFENQRGEATFNQNDRQGRAFAEVHYNGTGLMKAVWEVQEPSNSDFRVLQTVNYHLTFGDRIVFETPSVPGLPTIATGRHTLRFRILDPVSGFALPVITYFVQAAPQNEPNTSAITLKSPAFSAHLAGSEPFGWSGKVNGTLVKFSVYEKTSVDQILPVSPSVEPLPGSNKLSGSKILQSSDLVLVRGAEIFSAALPAGSTSFTAKAEQLKRLHSGAWYVWQVQTLDASGKVIAESELRSFQLLNPAH